MLLIYQVKQPHKAGFGWSTILIEKAVLKFLFCNARCCIISLPRNLNLRTLKLGICWCGFSCPCQHSSPVWVLFLGFCSLGTQKMSLRHMCRCQQRQVVNCNMFKSEEILNLHICSLLLLLPCKPKLGFHNWHQTKKKKSASGKMTVWLCSCGMSETIPVAGTPQCRCPVPAGPSTNPNEGSTVRMAGSGLWHLFEETIASRNLREDCRGED